VKKEQRSFSSDEEARQFITEAVEPFSTIYAVIAVLGLRPGEVLGLRVGDVDFEKRIMRVMQSVNSATRKPKP